ncbi:hypothetical protein C8F01DRAFT_1111218 [Mycena amicta]|nr:hypothetical protein C8F01DRAFT_1111218 [Mycena amicta]
MPRVPATQSRLHAAPIRPSGQPSGSTHLEPTFTPRKRRSGAHFSPYELVLDDVDLDALLSQRLAEQDAYGDQEDPEIVVLPGLPLPDDHPAPSAVEPHPISTLPTPLTPPTSFVNPSPLPLSATANSKLKKKAKRAQQRAAALAVSSAPYLKGVGLKRVRDAAKRQVQVNADAAELPHTIPAWTGHPRQTSSAADATTFELDATVLEGLEYTQEEVDRLSKAYGLRYLRWNGRDTIPIIDLRRRLLALLAGQPHGDNWPGIVEAATTAMEERAPRVKLSQEKLEHRRAERAFPSLARGVSHRGGQKQPGELLIVGENKTVTDELLAHDAFKRIVGFTTYIFGLWMPMLFAAYSSAKQTFGKRMPALRWPFAGSAFAACTWNFITTVCAAHVDFANLAWGWCAITALGRFNPDRGGHLIIWCLRLIIRFPPGSTIFIPSTLLMHSNTPIQDGETRSSFVQYSAGGLFRWIDQDFMTQEEFLRTASDAELEAARVRAGTRWAEGIGHFTVIDDLFSE